MIVVLMGVSGCGKTAVGQALAAELGWPFFDADDFHPPANVAKMAAGTPLTDDDRWPWLDRLAAKMAAINAIRRQRRARVLRAEAGVPRPARRRGRRPLRPPQGRSRHDRRAARGAGAPLHAGDAAREPVRDAGRAARTRSSSTSATRFPRRSRRSAPRWIATAARRGSGFSRTGFRCRSGFSRTVREDQQEPPEGGPTTRTRAA